MCNQHSAFSKLDISRIKTVSVANGETVEVQGEGTVEALVLDNGGTERQIRLTGVLWILALDRNLFSVRAMAKHGHQVNFGEKGSTIQIRGSRQQLPIHSKKTLCHLNENRRDRRSQICQQQSRPPILARESWTQECPDDQKPARSCTWNGNHEHCQAKL